VRSMTGYGHYRAEGEGFYVEVELQSYNHRFLDLKIKMPGEHAGLEQYISRRIHARFKRARINANIQLHISPGRAHPVVNKKLASGYWSALEKLRHQLSCQENFSPDTLLGLPGVLTVDEGSPTHRDFRKILGEALEGALDKLETMRDREGKKLSQALGKHLRRLEMGLKAVVRAESKKKNDKANVDEELERLQGHIEQFHVTLTTAPPVGKTLEFITREMLREVTTLADKSNNLGISRHAIAMKVAIESLKEQARNAE